MDTLKMGPACGEIKYSETVTARLSASRRLAAFLWLAGCATLALALAMPLPPAGMSVLALAIAAATIERRFRPGVRELQAHRSKALEVVDATGRHRTGAFRDGSFVAPWLTIIRWRPEGARFDRTILILPDMIDAHEFRRLRVLLKWA